MAYFPNSTAAEPFLNECAGCPIGNDPCPTALVHGLYNYDQVDNETATAIMESLVHDDGECQTRKVIEEWLNRQ